MQLTKVEHRRNGSFGPWYCFVLQALYGIAWHCVILVRTVYIA